jgi:hypothetical protein
MSRTFLAAMLVAALACCKTSKTDSPAPEPARSVAVATPAAQPALPAATEPAAPPAAAPAEPTAGSNTELETKGIATMQRMADMFAADARDCERLATDLKAFIAENKPLIAQLVELEDHQSDAARAAFTRRNAQTQAQIGLKMQQALTTCASNPGVLAAMKEFPGE